MYCGGVPILGPRPRYRAIETHTGDCALCSLVGVQVTDAWYDGVQITLCQQCASDIRATAVEPTSIPSGGTPQKR
jgi:ribosome-binding protein aMBF1 (putative translation factor)